MTQSDLEHIYRWFHSYVEQYSPGDAGVGDMYGLKRKHSMLVAANCRDIAAELGWETHAVNIGEACGVLHDTGRFSQFHEYGTFRDPGSINHGERGFEVLQALHVLDFLDSDTRAVILDAVRYHNARELPVEQTPEERLPYVRLIRDADKLDIYRVFVEEIQSEQVDDHLQRVLDATTTSPYNQAVLDDIHAGRVVLYDHVQSAVDFHLLRLSWVFDINYKPTLTRIRDRGYIEHIIQCLPQIEPVVRAAAAVVESLSRRAGDAHTSS